MRLVLRFRHPFLWLWLGFLLARRGPPAGHDWFLFVYGSKLLFGHGGLHAFAIEPQLHMGPLCLLAVSLLRAIFTNTVFATSLAMAGLGPPLVWIVERAAVQVRGLRDALDEPLLALVTLVSGAAFLRTWIDASWAYLHLEEAFVVAGIAVTAWCISARRPIAAGATIGLAIAARLSAVLLLPLLACFDRRSALRATLLAAALALLAWLPFLAADTGTVDAAKGLVGIFPQSGLRVLGVDASWPPGWVRPTQVCLGLALALFAVWRGRWEGAMLAAFASRLALDPSTSSYYTAGLVFAALLWDLAGRRPLPVWAPLIAIAYELTPRFGASADLEGIVRFAVAAAAVVAVVAEVSVRPRHAVAVTAPA